MLIRRQHVNFWMHYITSHVVAESTLDALWDQVISTEVMGPSSIALLVVPCMQEIFFVRTPMNTHNFTINFNTKSRMTAYTLKFKSQTIGPSQTITMLYHPHFLWPIYVYLVQRKKNYSSNTLHLQDRSMIIKRQSLREQIHTIISVLLRCSLRLAITC